MNDESTTDSAEPADFLSSDPGAHADALGNPGPDAPAQPQSPADAIYLAALAGEEKFQGRTLAPVPALMRTLWNKLGMTFGTFTADQVAEFAERGTYPGLELDLQIFMWFRLQPKSAIFSALRAPNEWTEKAVNGAAALGIRENGPAWAESFALFMAFWQRIAAVTTEPADDDAGEAETGARLPK